MLKYCAFSAQDCALLEAWTLVVLTSNAWPSSKSNVTTQKQVTHLLKRSQGNTGPSYSLARNISSPSQSAIFLGNHLWCFETCSGYSVQLTSFPERPAPRARCFLGNKQIPRAILCSKMASCSDGQKRHISHSDELLRLSFKPGNVFQAVFKTKLHQFG